MNLRNTQSQHRKLITFWAASQTTPTNGPFTHLRPVGGGSFVGIWTLYSDGLLAFQVQSTHKVDRLFFHKWTVPCGRGLVTALKLLDKRWGSLLGPRMVPNKDCTRTQPQYIVFQILGISLKNFKQIENSRKHMRTQKHFLKITIRT